MVEPEAEPSNPADVLNTMPPAIKSMIAAPFFIGQIAMEWSKLEFILCWVGARLLGTTLSAGERVIKGLGSGAQMELLCSLATVSEYSENVRNKLGDISKVFQDLNAYRNRVVHGHWASVDEEGVMYIRSVKARGSKAPLPDFSGEEIGVMMKKFIEIQQLTSSVFELVDLMDAEIPDNQKRLKAG
jgi:hypothetical protein